MKMHTRFTARFLRVLVACVLAAGLTPTTALAEVAAAVAVANSAASSSTSAGTSSGTSSSTSETVSLSLVDTSLLTTDDDDESYADESTYDDGGTIVSVSSEEMELSMIGLDELVASCSSSTSLSSGSASLLSTASASTLSSSITVNSYSGSNRIETSVMAATSTWSSSDYAIIVGSTSWADALAASGFAGLYECPIILTKQSTLSSSVKSALTSLGVKHVFILGDENSVSATTATSIKSVIGEDPVRICGADRYETQMAIFEYGLNNPDGKTWSGALAIVSNGSSAHFADALSASSGAYAACAPVFLAHADGSFDEEQMAVLEAAAADGFLQTVLVTGDTASIASETEEYLQSICPQGSSGVIRKGGSNRYATSALIAKWMVNNIGLTWDNAAFATGALPYDALGAGAAQGKSG